MLSRRAALPLAMILTALLVGAVPPTTVPRAVGDDAPVGQWIIGLHDGVDLGAITGGLEITTTFGHALNGFSALLTDALANTLAGLPGVAFVERDRTFSVAAVPTGVDRIDGELVPAGGPATGRAVDVDVAVIDTGIDGAHADLNVVQHVDCVSGLLAGLLGGGGECTAGGSDGNGHGTHVAGTIGALDNGAGVVGVAPGARLWGVRVLNNSGSGSTTDIIKGIDWVTARADQVEVINLSLTGSGTSAATNTAIANATNAGIVVVVSAGNQGADASGYTPANAPQAVTVSAFSDTDGKPGSLGGECYGADDTFASYSNFGGVVELAAPGSCIVSTSVGGGTTELSGTSMASPHVAGAAALWIDQHDVPRNGNRKATVLSGLLGDWSVTQASICGFGGGRSAERVLHLTACGTAPGPEPEPEPDPEPEPEPEPEPDPEPEPEPAATAQVGTIRWQHANGFLIFAGWVDAWVQVVDQDGAAVVGATVSINLYRNGALYASRTATTAASGEAYFATNGAPNGGCWAITVTAVTVADHEWDGQTPANQLCR